MKTGDEIQVHSNSTTNRKIGDQIEITQGVSGGIVAIGTVVAVIAGLSGAVTLIVRVLAGG